MKYMDLKKAVAKLIPVCFMEGFIDTEYFCNECPDCFVRFDSKGHLTLPDEFVLISKTDTTPSHLQYKGQEWFFRVLMQMWKNEHVGHATLNRNTLADLFIFTFLSEYGEEFTPHCDHMINSFYELSKKAIIKAGIKRPHGSVEHYFIPSEEMQFTISSILYSDSLSDLLYEYLSSAEKFAVLIVDVISSCTQEYNYTYCCYHESEYARLRLLRKRFLPLLAE